MPKRNKSRGGGRGGSRSSRGGYIGGAAKKKAKGRGRHMGNRSNPNPNKEYVELFDLNNPDFVSVNHPERSMKATAQRTRGRRSYGMQNEAFNTEDNRESTMKLPLRNRPVEFILSTTYDPTRDLIKNLSEKNKKSRIIENEINVVDETKTGTEDEFIDNSIDDIEVEEEEIEDEIEDEIEQDKSEEVELDEELVYSEEFNDGNLESVNRIDIKIKKPENEVDQLQSIPDSNLFFVDDQGSDKIKIKTVEIEETIAPIKSAPNTEFNPVLSVGHVHLSTVANDKGESEVHLPAIGKKNKNLKNINFDGSIYELDNDSDNDLYDTNTPNTRDLYQSYNTYISRVLNNLDKMDEDDEDNEELEELNGIYDELDDDFEEEANFIAGLEEESEEEELNGDINQRLSVQKLKNLKLEETNELDESNEPEYGFLPEDYETFDISLVDIINIRYGSTSNQYFIKSFRLTGLDEFQWIDQDIFQDFLLENGMPEHRLNAYFKFVQNQLQPQDELNEKDYDNLPISDSSDEDVYDERNYELSEDENDNDDDNDNDNDDGEDEGLEDLVKYSKRYDGLRDMEVEPTQALKTRGKGRKKELNLDHISDMDLRQSLADQYQSMRQSKREKKSQRESNIQKEHSNSKDLSLKYPYSFHIKEIRDEFELFLHDSKRQALTFPPMDPHGIKTLMKIAYYYNMKSRKFGKGLKIHAVIIKNKRTFHSLPDYHSIGQLMRQRRVFNRIDQKRPRTEVEAEQSKSSRRGNSSKAHVKEGDIVGADAPEISSNNVGRKLLMKMGWSSGQGLGLDNRGVAEPVIAKIKKTKLGIR
ncbi:hypothetical protein WICMUC_004266 [Wickerhamomyces mucosus]|uniref:Protein SQS1 n=1 Tax=Wickerhamomyces mucosus TaxID=1378264 RepID=A0A9P8PJ13_9ASCO|nr:hypothetical protein WICMUC_004266 [Wickerhamomyces mucosus]